jgi:long-chain acyl-CoA synthetase
LALPAFHVYGMTVGMLMCISLGGELVQAPDPRNTLQILETIAHEKITLYPGVPAMYIAIINHPQVAELQPAQHPRLSERRRGAAGRGGAAVREITGGKLVEGYGMSESSPLTAGNPVFGQTKIGSVGMPIPSTEIAVIALEPDEQGKYAFLGVGQSRASWWCAAPR